MLDRRFSTDRLTPVRRRRLAVRLTAGAVAATMGGVILVVAQSDTAAPATAASAPPTRLDAAFQAECSFSHRNDDDPIVLPGQQGRSHTHDFYGNPTTDAFSSADGMRKSKTTTCNNPFDKAAYWVANLRENGQPLTARSMIATYQARFKKKVEPFPPGLKIVSGNATATSPQPLSTVEWSCNDDVSNASSSVIPSCPNPDKPLTLTVWFPDCWNGKDLDSPDHASHMAFSSAGTCPAGHPVPVPGLKETVFWPDQKSGDGLRLSAMDSPLTGHADFVNSWDQAGHAAFVGQFLNVFNSTNVIGGLVNGPLRAVIGKTAGPANRPEPAQEAPAPRHEMPGMPHMPGMPK